MVACISYHFIVRWPCVVIFYFRSDISKISSKLSIKMDDQLEFSSQAFCKMIMHTMKYPYSICCGLLLAAKPSTSEPDSQNEKPSAEPVKIIDAIPVLHSSHYLAPTMEVALNAVNNYAKEQELSIAGYYQVDKFDPPACLDIFGQRVTEKIAESYPNAVLCLIGYEPARDSLLRFWIDQHQLVDGKWRRKPTQSYKVENDLEMIKEKIICSEDRLYREIVDFDDHLNDLNLDWTNAKISQTIDHVVANIC